MRVDHGERGIVLVLALELVHEVVDQTVVKVLTTQVSVTSSGLDLEDALLNGEQGNIEGTTTQVENEHVALALDFLVKTIGNGSSGWLINDTHNIQARNDSSILCGLALRVIEVGRNSDNCVLHGRTKVSLSNFLHLYEDHGGDFLSSELLVLTLVIDHNHGLLPRTRNNFEWPELHVTLD